MSVKIVEERGRSYGDPEVNMNRIAALWGSYLDCDITGHDVAWMMTLLKASRSKADPSNSDNYVDACGYVEIAERLS